MNEIGAVVQAAGPTAGLVSVVLYGVLAVWRGWLIPARRVADERQVYDDRLREAREREIEWRDAWKVSEASRERDAETARAGLEVAKTTEALIRALPSAPPRGPGDGT